MYQCLGMPYLTLHSVAPEVPGGIPKHRYIEAHRDPIKVFLF